MARTPRAGIDVAVNEAPATAGLKRLTKEFGSTAVAINQAAELGAKAWGAITGVISGAVSAVVDATKASMEAERIERRAIAALQAKTDITREQYAALKQANDARQQALGIDADEQLQLQGTLAALGVRADKLDEATRATIGLAAATGKGMEEAGKVAAKVYQGNANALQELGIRTSSAAEAQARLTEMYVLAEAQSDTLEARLQALGAGYGDLQETLGATITQSSAAKDMTEAMTAALGDLTAYLSAEEGRRAVDGFFRYFALSAANAIDALEGMRKAAVDTLNWFKVHFTDEVVVESLAPQETALERLAGRMRAIGTAPVNVESPEAALDARGGRPTPSRAATRTAGGSTRAMGPQPMDEAVLLHQRELERESARQWNETLQADLRLAEFEKGLAQREAARSEFEARMALMQELHDREIEFSASMSTAMLEQTKAEADARQQTLASVAAQTRDTLGQQMAQMVVAVASGEKSLGDALESFVGGIVTSLGTMLIQLGTAAIAANLLSVVPVLGTLVGPPGAGVAAGLAAIAAGSGMVALGSLMGGGARAGGSTAPPMTGGGGGSVPRAPSLDTGRGFLPSFAMAGASAAPYTVNVNFNGVVGDERRAARMIEDVLRRGR